MLNYQTHAILKLLSYNKNVILQGAPGTGKTWSIPEVVTRLCGRVPNDQEVDRHTVIEAYKRLLDEGRVVFTTFHPSYDYEDFVEGWVPGSEGDGVDTSGQNPLHVRPGIFRQICRDAAQSAFIEEAEKLADENFNISDKADVWKVSLCHTGPNPLRELCLANNCGICQASFPEISQKNRYQLSSSRDVVPDPRIFVYQSRSIDRPRNVLSCSHGTGRDPDDRYHSRSPRIRAGRSFLIHLLLFNRFRWLLRI